jgi:hypothetical protein
MRKLHTNQKRVQLVAAIGLRSIRSASVFQLKTITILSVISI